MEIDFEDNGREAFDRATPFTQFFVKINLLGHARFWSLPADYLLDGTEPPRARLTAFFAVRDECLLHAAKTARNAIQGLHRLEPRTLFKPVFFESFHLFINLTKRSLQQFAASATDDIEKIQARLSGPVEKSRYEGSVDYYPLVISGPANGLLPGRPHVWYRRGREQDIVLGLIGMRVEQSLENDRRLKEQLRLG